MFNPRNSENMVQGGGFNGLPAHRLFGGRAVVPSPEETTAQGAVNDPEEPELERPEDGDAEGDDAS